MQDLGINYLFGNMKKTWINVRKKQPEHLQNVFFVSTSEEVFAGFFLKPDGKNPSLVGSFRVGTIYDKKTTNEKLQAGGGAWGIGFNVWKENSFEVTHWMPLNYPKPPKK